MGGTAGNTKDYPSSEGDLRWARMDPLIIAFGLGVGVLIGLTGVGGGLGPVHRTLPRLSSSGARPT